MTTIASDDTAASQSSQESGTGPFVLDLARQPNHFKDLDGAVFDVSSRFILPNVNILDYLKTYYMYLRVEQVDTVFGNVAYPSKLYGGRPYKLERSLTDAHLAQLQAAGLGLSLTLTNHFFDADTYRQNLDFLERLHISGNTIVCTNDELAHQIRQDFPKYKLKASLIKHLNTQKKVEWAYRLYDYVVIPMDKNDDEDFLLGLPEKERVYLFGNANCAYNCPSRSCYVGISQKNQHRTETAACSIPIKPRANEGHIYFNVQAFRAMGYHRFKMVPNSLPSAQTALRILSQTRKIQVGPAPMAKAEATIWSYPKSGRTWLRFMLANYINAQHGLGIPINFQSIFTLLPNDNDDLLKGRANYQFRGRSDLPLVTFEHSPLPSHREVKSILLLRAIPDVVVSDYFHRARLLGNLEVRSLEEFIHANTGGLHQYLKYLNTSLCNAEADTLVLTYESMQQRPADTLKQVLNHVGILIEASALQSAVAESDFITMQKLESALGIAGHPAQNKADPEARRVRKGKINGYLDYLDDEQIEYCRRQAELVLHQDTKNRLMHLGLYPF